MATKDVSMTNLINPLDPASAANAYQVQRQMAMAQALQQQAFQPMEDGKMVSGWYVAPGKNSHIAKIAESLMGMYAGKVADQNAGDLQKSNMESMVKALDPNGPTQAVDPAIAGQVALQNGAASGSVGPTAQNGQSMDAMTTPAQNSTGSTLNPLKMNPQLAARLLMADPTKFYEIQSKFYEPTETQRNNNYLGIGMDEARRMEVAKRVKEGRLEVQPNNTVVDPVTMRPLFAAPDFKTGIQGGFDGNGQAKMGLISGAEAIPQMAGLTKRAEAGGTAAYNMTTVDTPNGPVMMTTEQAAKLAGGVGAAPINFTASNGVKLDIAGKTPQQLIEIINQVKDPAQKQEMSQAFNEWATSGRAPQDAPGIKLLGAAAKKQQEGQGTFFSDTYSDIQKKGMASNDSIGRYNRLTTILDGIDTGKFTGGALEIKKAAKAAGIDLGDNNIAPLEAARKITSEMALMSRNTANGGGMPGAMSDADREFLVNMQPGIETTPGGRKLIVDSALKIERRNQEIAKLAREYNGGNLDNGFFKVVQDYADAHPLFEGMKIPAAIEAPGNAKPDYKALYGIRQK